MGNRQNLPPTRNQKTTELTNFSSFPDLNQKILQKKVCAAGSEGLRAVGEKSEADELRTLRRENSLLKQENDILKKAAVILGTRPQLNSGK